MWVWIVAGIMGFFFFIVLIMLISMLVHKRGYGLQHGARPEKRKQYNSSYRLQRGDRHKVKHISLRTGRLQRGARPKRRLQINLD